MAVPTAIVVDDEFDMAEIFSELLKLLDVKIIGIGHTGRDAVRLVQKQKPNIAFLDIHMPELNGIEALKEIKKISPATYVIMITSDRFADAKQLVQYGATDVIFKPFDMIQIQKVFDQINAANFSMVSHE